MDGYPDVGLPSSVLYALLLNGELVVDNTTFVVNSSGRWQSARDALVRSGTIQPVDRLPTNDWIALMQSGVTFPEGSAKENAWNVLFCLRNGIPFSASEHIEDQLPRVLESAATLASALDIPGASDVTVATAQSRQLAKWTVDLRVSALELRRERHIAALMKAVPPHWKEIVMFNLKDAFFLSPDELAELLLEGKGVATIRRRLRELTDHVASSAALNDQIHREHEELELRLGASGWVFTGIDLALSWLPASFVLTAPAKWLVDKRLKRPADWLISLAHVNKKLAGR